MSADVVSSMWSALIELNRQADALVEKCRRAVEKSQPISREIPFYGSIEALFENLPTSYGATVAVNSDALAGNNVKQVPFTNMGSRIYVREISFQSYGVTTVGRVVESFGAFGGTARSNFMFNWRWNFLTSITQRKYADKRVLAPAGGRWQAGNHIAFREPLIIEPMETFQFDCELLNSGMSTTNNSIIKAVISMYLSGYREGI